MKILIAESDKSTRATYIMTIKQAIPQAEIDEVAGSRAMLAKALGRNYNLIIANETLPKRMPAAKIIRVIREYDKKIPIFVYGEKSDGEELLKAGGTAFYSRNSLTDISKFVKDLKNLI